MTTTSSSSFGPFGAFSPESFQNFWSKADFINTMTSNAAKSSSASARASVKGMQDVNEKIATYIKSQIDLSLEADKKLSTVTSFHDTITIQADYVQSAVENNLNSLAELSKVYTDAACDVFAPLAKKATKTKQSA